MALKKKMVKDNGLTTEYHRILHIHINCEKDAVASVSIASYKDESFRQKEKNGECDSTYISIENYTIETDMHKDDLKISSIYKKIKDLAKFAEATDC